MHTSAVARAAGVLLGLEAAGLFVVVALQIAALSGGDAASIDSSVALIVLTAIGAVALAAFGVAVWRGQSWGRSGGIVAQVLILAIALGAVTGAYAHPLTGLALAVPAVVVLVLLILAARRARPDRDAGDEASR
ncbi:histidine kinase [Microbacterium sp. B2969]|uniref:Histidine kinase n=1 Tax=Microbacterium alkaliflavum TaxID=3248839 RepID=A0ABW7Q7E9_9MICO